MAVAGRILIMPKGNYDASVTYEMLDLVNHNGISWLCKKTAKGIEPSEGEYWQQLLGITIANDIETTEEGKVLDARQGKVLGDRVKELEQFRDYTLSDGFYGRKQGRMATLYLTGHQVGTQQASNGGEVGEIFKPLFDVTFPLIVVGIGVCVGVINTSGNFTVYSEDMSQYVSGTVQGVVSYLVAENDL